MCADLSQLLQSLGANRSQSPHMKRSEPPVSTPSAGAPEAVHAADLSDLINLKIGGYSAGRFFPDSES